MTQVISTLFGGNNSAKRAADEAANQAAVASARQTSLQQEEQARLDRQAGAVIKSPRGQRLLLDGPTGGSDLAAKVA
jgi:hypothetical protein